MKIRIIGHCIDPYTWEIIKINEIVNIGSEAAAIKWAKQTYFKASISSAVEEL